MGHLDRNVERAVGSLGNEVRDSKTDIRVTCMVVTGGTMTADEVLKDRLGEGCHYMRRELKETPGEKSGRKEKIQLTHGPIVLAYWESQGDEGLNHSLDFVTMVRLVIAEGTLFTRVLTMESRFQRANVSGEKGS